MWTKQPFRKGSVLDALIQMRKQDGEVWESTATSDTDKWYSGEKLARFETVNSAECRKVHAAQNLQWSNEDRSKAWWMTKRIRSVTGRRWAAGEPWERLIPRKTRCKRKQLIKGSGKPCSIWSEHTAERYTLIDECWTESARKETNKHKVHSSAGHGDPFWWSLPAWRQKS